jgi:hypothetical protein
MYGRTTFIISHSPVPLEKCDMLLFIEAGRINKERSRQSEPAF